MRVAVFSTKPYDEQSLRNANEAGGGAGGAAGDGGAGGAVGAAGDGAVGGGKGGHELVFLEPRLSLDTAALAAGCEAVCAFVNDDLGSEVLTALAGHGVRLVALRSAGFNHVDLATAARLRLTVARVPGYSPYAVAEHCVGLILALNRKIHRAHNRVRENNFALTGLLGFDLYGKTVGVIGTGKIGVVFTRIMSGFGCRVLAFDPYPSDDARRAGAEYVPLPELLAASHIVTLHCPLTAETHHLIDAERIGQMRKGVMLINTSRGALVDTSAVIGGLRRGQIGYVGLDVYEEEADLFFEDLSDQVLRDDVFTRLIAFPNVLVTGHQAFFTEEALHNIAATTIANLDAFEYGEGTLHHVLADGPA